MTTRRNFLADVGRAGGFGATYLLMQSLGLLPILASEASVLRLPGTIGKGKKLLGSANRLTQTILVLHRSDVPKVVIEVERLRFGVKPIRFSFLDGGKYIDES